VKLFAENREYINKTIHLAWPSVMEYFLVALVGIVDTLMVSSLGTKAVAAVGLTMNPKFVALVIFMSLNIAVSALVARRKGQEDREGVNSIFLISLLISLVLGILISVIGVVFADAIISIAGSNAETHDDAVCYFQIVIGCLLIHILSLSINAVQRGIGNPTVAMKTNLISNFINLTGSFLLIQGRFGLPKLGVMGAAIASVIGTVIALCMSIASVIKKDGYVSWQYIIEHHLLAKWNALSVILKLALPILVEQFFMRIGFLLVAFMVARLGTQAFAANQVAMNVMGLSFSFGDGLSIAAVALIGESLGKGCHAEAKKYVKICSIFGSCISILLAVSYLIFGRHIIMLFFQEEEVIQYGVQIMYMLTLIVPLQVMQVVYMGSLRGAGDTLFTAIVSGIGVAIVRPLFGFIFCNILGVGLVGIWIGVLLDQIVRVMFTAYRFKTDKWTEIKI
jgi:putative MATE family efflux protein